MDNDERSEIEHDDEEIDDMGLNDEETDDLDCIDEEVESESTDEDGSYDSPTESADFLNAGGFYDEGGVEWVNEWRDGVPDDASSGDVEYDDEEIDDVDLDDEEMEHEPINDDSSDNSEIRIMDWREDIYAPGEHTVDLVPDPNFDPDAEINIDYRYDQPEDSDDSDSFTYEPGDERADEWLDEVPDDAGSGQEPWEFTGDPFDNEEMDRFLRNHPSSPSSYDTETLTPTPVSYLNAFKTGSISDDERSNTSYDDAEIDDEDLGEEETQDDEFEVVDLDDEEREVEEREKKEMEEIYFLNDEKLDELDERVIDWMYEIPVDADLGQDPFKDEEDPYDDEDFDDEE